MYGDWRVHQRGADVYVETRLSMSGQYTVEIFEANTQPLSGDFYVKLQPEDKKKTVWWSRATLLMDLLCWELMIVSKRRVTSKGSGVRVRS